MIASLITALYLLGAMSAAHAATFLYICGALLILGELAFTLFGILAFNGLLALMVGYTIQTGNNVIFGLNVDWSLLFGIAFIEMFIIALSVFIVLKYHGRKSVIGGVDMEGETAEIVEWDGKKGLVRIQGEIWKAESQQALDLSANDKVMVSAVDKLTLTITAA